MSRYLTWLCVAASSWACSEQATQAVVTVEIDDTLQGQLSSVSVESLDDGDRARGDRLELALRGPGAEKPPFSFGVVPRADNVLRMRIIGYQDDHAVAIEQRVVLPLTAGRATPITVLLREACTSEHCGSAATCRTATLREGVFSCDPSALFDAACTPAELGCACADPQRCAGLDGSAPPPDAMLDGGADTSDADAADGATADGDAAPAHDSGAGADNGSDAALCALAPRSNPKTCVNCTAGVIYCPFEGCVRGPCEHSVQGLKRGTGDRLLEPHRMYGQQFIASADGQVSWLGIGVLTGGGRANPRFMIGLYENLPNDKPGQLLASTPPIRPNNQFEEDTVLLSVYGLEYPLQSSVRVRAGTKYWLFVIANEPLNLTAQVHLTRTWQKSISAEDFAELHDRMPATPINQSMLADEPGPPTPAGDLYLVTLPLSD